MPYSNAMNLMKRYWYGCRGWPQLIP